MTTGTQLGAPAAATYMQAPAKNLVDVAHRERDVIKPRLAIRQLQHEQVVVPTVGRTSHERSAPRISVGNFKSKQFVVELFLLSQSVRK
ncbi:hypothetical protein AWB76_07885 [Caballeronia temeraria]|uniref:Uncharacterized protein n=1 Tax=Caballeronia temeraria TaxID=1777137 RepID=A0A158E219_9BURK|nr:hypothetical protein AWB76_07885 [Caballeronia temeraria]